MSMLERRQRRRLLNKVIEKFYRRGRAPKVREVLETAARWLGKRLYGRPYFTPRAAIRTQIIAADDLTLCLSEAQEDLSVLYEDVTDCVAEQVISTEAFAGRADALSARLTRLGEELDGLQTSEDRSGREVFADSFRDMSHTDLFRTTAQIDTRLGQVSLLVSQDNSVRLHPGQVSLVRETYPNGGRSTGDSFLSVFNDLQTAQWQATLPAGTSYIAEIALSNFTASLNTIGIEPTGPLSVTIEWSQDGAAYFPLLSAQILNDMAWEFPPILARYLRFVLTAENAGVSRISVGHTLTNYFASFYSNNLLSETPLTSLDFDWDTITPPGTAIRPYVATDPEGPWIPINPGQVDLAGVQGQTITFGSSGEYQPDNLHDPASLWVVSSTDVMLHPEFITPLNDAGEMWRGIGQFRVDAFVYDWGRLNDPYHLPDVADWQQNYGTVQSVYMTALASGDDIDGIPSGTISDAQSFLVRGWARGNRTYWGVACQHGADSSTQDGNNYRMTSWLYSDRDSLVTSAGGGAFALNNTLALTPGPYVCWSLYVNDNRVGGSDLTYPTLPLGVITGTYSDLVLGDSPHLYYRFGDTDYVLRDSSSGSHDGTYVDFGNPGWVEHGIPGPSTIPDSITTAYYWDTVSSDYGYSTVPSGQLRFAGSWSIDFWVRDRKLTTPWPLIIPGPSKSRIHLGPVVPGVVPSATFVVNTSPYSQTNLETSGAVFMAVPLVDQNWHHVTFTYDAGTTTIRSYLDGVLYRALVHTISDDSASVTNITPATNALGLACLAELAFYNSVLSSGAVAAHYAAGAGDGIDTGGDQSFSLPLTAGWNKIDLYVYQPLRADLPARMVPGNQDVVLLFTPDIFSFTPAANWSLIPTLSEYPLWADGTPMQRVSEFTLKWDTPLLQTDRWAWRIDAARGVPDAALFNYNPGVGNLHTLDGYWKGSEAQFRLRYPAAAAPSRSFYFRCDLARDDSAETAPYLSHYRFIAR